MNKLLAGAAAAAIVLCISPALAQQAPPRPPGVAQGTAPMVMQAPHSPPVISSPVRVRAARIERVMTRDEILQHVRSMFSRVDTNHDGFITKNEMAALHVHMMGMHDAMAHEMAGRPMRMGGGPMTMDDHPMAMNPGAMFDKLDTNRDGMISRQEFMAGHARMRERRVIIMRDEKTADAMPGMEQMKMRMHGMGEGGMAEHFFAMADANHDGRISLHEAEAAVLAHFDRMDLNHDGRITPDERRQAHGMMHERHPG